MHFSLNNEQTLLRNSLRAFLRDRYPFSSRKDASQSDKGWRPDIWRALGKELGILGAALPEDVGGSGGGPVENMIVMEELGRALALEPFAESVVMAGGLLRRAVGQRARDLLAAVLAGDDTVAVGWNEPGARFGLATVGTQARKQGDGWCLDGHKVAVIGAQWGSSLIVTARSGGAASDRYGISLFLVERERPGVTLREYHTIDGRRAADVVLDGVMLPADALLGAEGQAFDLIERIADEAVAAQCAEAVGLMERMLEDTVAYTRQREQFGQPISSFQVLQHRMADMMIQVELARSSVYGATLKLDAEPAERARAASAAKVTTDQACRFVGQNAIQLHGGMGMSDELPVTHYFKRATVLGNTLGSADFHVRRFAGFEREAA
ncbi:acyl-CoA dehydrogenase family protein [Cupriavidus lacunae]|uniref:Pimeloyl-CoA dehydrogenase small subunit n=1 Tax=Cupriavidus lacunae TaxID=2666307 RepID=A0A370NX04_9BURK|nr:acyl-CoA dehydrogenase family protein [Cupriavidus lacunae]RDK10126.1 pimeloyl-CoA dehydrogenase small subunit [Cupriavidus lacunae]